MIKIDLGCGPNKKEGFTGIDLYIDADIRHDVSKPLPFQKDSVDEIYASHLIEHLTRREWKDAIKNWRDVLKSGGTMELICPDFDVCLDNFKNNIDGGRWTTWIASIYGGQEDYGQGQLHKNGFTQQHLREELESVGLKVLQDTRDFYRGELHFICQKP